jgi:hypothetical protein
VKKFSRGKAEEGVDTEIDDDVREQSSQVNQESNSNGTRSDSDKDGKQQVNGNKQGQKQGDGGKQDADKQQSEDKKGTEADEEPAKLTDPIVLGKIIWLRPANKAAIMFASVEKDSTPNKEKKKLQEELIKDELRQKISDDQVFDVLVVPADAVTMCTLRDAAQSLQDHFMDQCRTGLGMPIRTVGGEHLL